MFCFLARLLFVKICVAIANAIKNVDRHPASHDTRENCSPRPLQTIATETTCLGRNKLSFRTFTTSGLFYRRIEVELQR